MIYPISIGVPMKATVSTLAITCFGALGLISCGGGSGSSSSSSTSTTLSTSSPESLGKSFTSGGPWGLGYIAMGAVGGPNITAPTSTSTGGQDDFGGKPINVAFEYAGDDGRGNPGDILAPMNLWKMTQDWGGSPARFSAPATPGLVNINQFPTRIAMVEYTAQMSGGQNVSDFSNGPPGQSSSDPNAAYIMAKHFISLGADAQMMVANPVVYNGKNYYGTLIMNPDLLGAIQQNNYIDLINAPNGVLGKYDVNVAVAQAMCLLNTKGTYLNTFNPNLLPPAGVPYINKTYTGTPVEILISMLKDGYPSYSFSSQNDPYWNSVTGNQLPAMPPNAAANTQIQTWFNACLNAKPTTQFPATLDGWVQANHYMIRSFAPKGTVTFGWQDNMWAVNTGYWVHNDLTPAQITAAYSGPVTNFLTKNAPSTMDTSANGADFFAFDRYEYDDSSWPSANDHATLDNARSWDNILTAVGQVSKNFNNIPIMLFQIPGSHITNTTEAAPEKLTVPGGGNPILTSPQQYVFSTAPVYFFGDSNLKSDLSNIMTGPTSITPTETMVGNFPLQCGQNTGPNATNPPGYNCLNNVQVTYQQYLLQYQGKPNNYDWSKDNGKLKLAAQNNVFAILWGGGETTSVIKNFQNNNDNGWLAGKIKAYFANPTPLSQ